MTAKVGIMMQSHKVRIATSACKGIALLFSFLFMSACATSSLFSSHTGYMNPVLNTVEAHEPLDKAIKRLNKRRKSKDKILYLMERGRILQISGDFAASTLDFASAIEAVGVDEDKAVISLSEKGAQASSILLNDNAIPYKGDGYEKVFLNHYQAINFLMTNNLEAAGVEIRRARDRQMEELKKNENEIEIAKNQEKRERSENQAKSAFMDNFTKQMEQKFAKVQSGQAVDEIAGKVKNSFQNAYTFYLSGIVYELLGEENDAYLDYKKALEIFPENEYVKRDMIRLAINLDMKDDLSTFEAAYGKKYIGSIANTGNSKGGGELIVFYEDGFVPQKQQFKINLPTTNGIISAAFPYYKARWIPASPLVIFNGSKEIGETEPIVYVRALAVKALEEKKPGMIFREVLRVTSKAIIQNAAAVAAERGAKNRKDKRTGRLVANIVTSIYNIATEKADVRSWLTLPKDVHILHTYMPSGVYELRLNRKNSEISTATEGAIKDSEISTVIEVTIMDNQKTILFVNGIGKTLYAKTATFNESNKQNLVGR